MHHTLFFIQILSNFLLSTLRVLIDSAIYSNFWISAGAVAFSFVNSILLGYQVPLKFQLFIFCTTLFTYNFQRLVKLQISETQKISGPRANWIKNNIIFTCVLTILSALASIFYGWVYFFKFGWMVGIIGFFSFFYVWRLPFLRISLRSIPGIKIIVLSSTWIIATGILPFLLFSAKSISLDSQLIFVSGFLFICAISIPFDIRDIPVDQKKLRTIPQIFGVRSAIWIAITMILLSVLLLIFANKNYNIGIILSGLCTIIIVYFSDKYKNELWFSGVVDGTLILQGTFFYFLP